MDYFKILCTIVVVLLAIYYYFASIYSHWKNRGIAGPPPKPWIGSFYNMVLRKLSISDQVREWYNEFKNEPVFGIFEGREPILVINDLDLVKDVLIKDFSLFVDRGFRAFPKAEPLGVHLFVLEAERWRPLRSRISPIFTSGKLKEMFPLILECAKTLEKYIDKVVETGEPVEVRDLAAKFTTDVIGSCAFGINMNSISDQDSEFRKMGKKIFAPGFQQTVRNFCRQFLPNMYEFIGEYIQTTDVNLFFKNLVVDSIKYRKENNVFRPDFIHLLMELQDHPEKIDNIELTDMLLTAQAFVFFVAGFETSSSTVAHALYALSQNKDIQDKLREEIKEAYSKLDGEMSYAKIKEMKYLDKVFKETLRMYPILPMLNRKSMESYTFRGTKISIPKDRNIWIPVYGIHHDPNIYPNPEIFDPERFSDEAVEARHPMAYLPFGDGPRNCIGARFANYQSKLGIITILRNHKVEVCEKTKIPFESDPRSFLLMLKGGVHLKLVKE